MVVNQFLVRGEIIGFNAEVVLFERLRAGWGTEVGAVRFSLLLRGEPAQPVFRHPGGGIPKRQLNRTPLVDAEGAVLDLKPAGKM